MKGIDPWFKTALERMSHAVIVTDAKGCIKFLNPAAESLTKWNDEEALGKDLSEVFMIRSNEETHTPAESPVTMAIHKGIEVYFSNHPMLIAKDGAEIPIHLCAVPVKDGEETIIGALLVFQDMNEYRQTKQTKEREERYRTLIQALSDIVYEIDTHGYFTFINNAVRNLGYEPEELIHRHFSEIIHPDDIESISHSAVLKKYSGRITGDLISPKLFDERRTGKRKTDNLEIRLMPKNQKEIEQDPSNKIGLRSIFGEVIATGHYDVDVYRKDKTFLGTVGIIRDITERKQLEVQFIQSQKMETVGRLAGCIAHDFNNLLTTILVYTQLMMSTVSCYHPMHRELQEIQKATERAANLTRQLLAFSHRQTLKPHVINLNDILLNMEKMLRSLIGEGTELIMILAPKLSLVKIDPSQFEQVIMNLVINAHDAMPHGGKLTFETANAFLDKNFIRLHGWRNPGEYVMLNISDTGIGMTDEVKDHLFEPFFTTKEKCKGTGLGLATCYGIVKQSGGNILVNSELGLGTTVKIYLPQVEELAMPLPRRDETASLPQGNETLLLVEDELSVRGLVARILRGQGYTVLEAPNGDEALRIAQDPPNPEIHLLLTDVVMPQMGGKELADRVKSIRPNIKVLFTSGYPDHTTVLQSLSDASMTFLQKPFSLVSLVQKVRDVLDG